MADSNGTSTGTSTGTTETKTITPSLRQKIVDFMEISGFDNRTSDLAKQMTSKFKMGIEEVGINADGRVAEALSLIDNHLENNRLTLQDAVVAVFAEFLHYNEDWADALLTFYRSDVGKALAQGGGSLEDKIVNAVADWAMIEIRTIDKNVAVMLGQEDSTP